MKNLKNTVAAITMMTVLAFGTTFANAGIIIAYKGDGNDRTKSTKTTACEEPKSESGIIIAFTGIIIAFKTGIIIAKDGDKAAMNCGIIIA